MPPPRVAPPTSSGPITSPTSPMTLTAIQGTTAGMFPQQITSGGLGPGDQYVPYYFSDITARPFALFVNDPAFQSMGILPFLLNNLFGMLCSYRSARVHARGASRGEWWYVRTRKAAAPITATSESNLASQRAATQDLVLCGTTASGER